MVSRHTLLMPVYRFEKYVLTLLACRTCHACKTQIMARATPWAAVQAHVAPVFCGFVCQVLCGGPQDLMFPLGFCVAGSNGCYKDSVYSGA
jgi:hypothetical protein